MLTGVIGYQHYAFLNLKKYIKPLLCQTYISARNAAL